MYNYKNYDCHLLLSSLRKFKGSYTSVIPQNSERFIFIICPKYYFVDSFMHLSTSLDNLTKNIHTKPVQNLLCYANVLIYLSLKKIARKGLYPYEYMDSFEKFRETSFPDISNWILFIISVSLDIVGILHCSSQK